jgi:hypothetical protein
MKGMAMKTVKNLLVALTLGAIGFGLSEAATAVDLSYAGTHNDIGGTFFPGGGPANAQSYVVVPWRSDGAGNTFSVSSEVGERYYGRDGYAMFATRFDYPNANATGGASAHPTDTFFPTVYPNLIDLPGFVAESQILASSLAGGWVYALIDDPVATDGARDWNWGDTQSPPSAGQAPYVKLGILNGWDQFGHDPANPDPESIPAGRWGFTVGADVPSSFRVGVMTDGLDNANFAPKEVFLGHVSALGNGAIYDFVSTGTMVSNRFVDMHFFDITGAQEGDSFSFGVKANDDSFGNAGVSGFSFDILPYSAIDNADFDSDSDVDGQDFLTWQRGFETGTTHAEGDANNNGIIDGDDLAVWADQFGTTSSVFAAAAVPEPTSLLLCIGALVCLTIRPSSHGTRVGIVVDMNRELNF